MIKLSNHYPIQSFMPLWGVSLNIPVRFAKSVRAKPFDDIVTGMFCRSLVRGIV